MSIPSPSPGFPLAWPSSRCLALMVPALSLSLSTSCPALTLPEEARTISVQPPRYQHCDKHLWWEIPLLLFQEIRNSPCTGKTSTHRCLRDPIASHCDVTIPEEEVYDDAERFWPCGISYDIPSYKASPRSSLMRSTLQTGLLPANTKFGWAEESWQGSQATQFFQSENAKAEQPLQQMVQAGERKVTKSSQNVVQVAREER